jgi:hypothetical protein
MWGRNLGFPEEAGLWTESDGRFSIEKNAYEGQNTEELQFSFPQVGFYNRLTLPGTKMPR